MGDELEIDYFAVSLPDFLVFDEDLRMRNNIHGHYMIALGQLGLGDNSDALNHLEDVLNLEKERLGVVLHKQLVNQTE